MKKEGYSNHSLLLYKSITKNNNTIGVAELNFTDTTRMDENKHRTYITHQKPPVSLPNEMYDEIIRFLKPYEKLKICLINRYISNMCRNDEQINLLKFNLYRKIYITSSDICIIQNNKVYIFDYNNVVKNISLPKDIMPLKIVSGYGWIIVLTNDGLYGYGKLEYNKIYDNFTKIDIQGIVIDITLYAPGHEKLYVLTTEGLFYSDNYSAKDYLKRPNTSIIKLSKSTINIPIDTYMIYHDVKGLYVASLNGCYFYDDKLIFLDMGDILGFFNGYILTTNNLYYFKDLNVNYNLESIGLKNLKYFFRDSFVNGYGYYALTNNNELYYSKDMVNFHKLDHNMDEIVSSSLYIVYKQNNTYFKFQNNKSKILHF